MFTGLDLVIVALVIFAFFYATGSGKAPAFKFEPLTFVLVAIVVGMVAYSLLNR